MGQGVLSPAFAPRDGALWVEGVPAATIAAVAGTPTYVYSAATLRDRYAALTAVLGGVSARVHYSLKANACAGVLRVLREAGSGVDVVSGGELFRALRAGFGGDDILFGGVGKTAEELLAAVRANVKMVNIESLAELELLAAAAAQAGRPVRVGLRVNPEVAVANAHHYIATGEKGHKFGIPWDEALAVGQRALALPGVELVGLDMHVGSQLHDLGAYEAGIARLGELAERLRAMGAPLRYLDIGGGLPVPYQAGDPDADLAAYGRLVVPAARAMGLELLVEPGRFLVAPSGMLLTRVLYRKASGGTRYVVCDAGMTELLRPSHYDAYHEIQAVRPSGRRVVADVVGPVCETGDFLALDREVDDVAVGDLLAVHTAGAYGYVMASTYNARPRAAEVLVDGDRWAVVTARETHDDLVRLEPPAPVWRQG